MDSNINNSFPEGFFFKARLSENKQLELTNLRLENAALKKQIGNLFQKSRGDKYNNNLIISKQNKQIEKLQIEVNALKIYLHRKKSSKG